MKVKVGYGAHHHVQGRVKHEQEGGKERNGKQRNPFFTLRSSTRWLPLPSRMKVTKSGTTTSRDSA